MTWVRELTDDPIVLVATRQRLESLPAYRADDEITDVVSSLLWYRSNMHPDDLRSVQVRTRDGIVHLSGETRTEQTRLAIEEQVRGVRGVLGVRNDLENLRGARSCRPDAQPARWVDRSPPARRPGTRTVAPRRPPYWARWACRNRVSGLRARRGGGDAAQDRRLILGPSGGVGGASPDCRHMSSAGSMSVRCATARPTETYRPAAVDGATGPLGG